MDKLIRNLAPNVRLLCCNKCGHKWLEPALDKYKTEYVCEKCGNKIEYRGQA